MTATFSILRRLAPTSMAYMHHVPSVSILLLALALGAGCSAPATSSSASTGEDRSSTASKSKDLRTGVAQLTKGMTQANVRSLLGEPESAVTRDTAIGTVDAWIYRATYTSGTREVQTGTNTYTRENLFTNVPETVTEPVFGIQNIYETDELTVVFRANQLIEWAVTRNQSHQVN